MKSANTPAMLSLDQARAVLERRGETVTAFARKHGLPPRAVYKLLYGISKGRNGNSHRAAVALGIKAGESPAVSEQR